MKKIIITTMSSVLLLSSATYASTHEKASINKQDTQALFGTQKADAKILNKQELEKINAKAWFNSIFHWIEEPSIHWNSPWWA